MKWLKGLVATLIIIGMVSCLPEHIDFRIDDRQSRLIVECMREAISEVLVQESNIDECIEGVSGEITDVTTKLVRERLEMWLPQDLRELSKAIEIVLPRTASDDEVITLIMGKTLGD